MVVRPARDDDAEGVIALVAGCFAEYEGCVLDTDTESPHLLHVATHFAALDGRVWVADDDGMVVGSAACRPAPADPGALELQLLYVAAGARRRGLASSFVAMVEDEARRRGLGRVVLWSDTRFHDAHRLYASLGYRRGGQTRLLHDLSESEEHFFSKELGPARAEHRGGA